MIVKKFYAVSFSGNSPYIFALSESYEALCSNIETLLSRLSGYQTSFKLEISEEFLGQLT